MTDPVVKKLRENATDAERKLWHHLRRKQVAGLRFRRQYRLGPYIVDFVCLPARLIIEVDGGQHADRVERDATLTAWLETQGFHVVRFWNNEVLGNVEGVLHVIGEHLSPREPPPPAPSREGRGKED
jgi:very-short-patch-repair endonuclease